MCEPLATGQSQGVVRRVKHGVEGVCVCVCVHAGKGLEEPRPQPQPMGLRGPMLCPQIASSGAQTDMSTGEILLVSA